MPGDRIDIEHQLVLLLTASINPAGMAVSASVAQPNTREQDYLRAIRFYVRRTPRLRRIVFAENSNWDLSAFEPLRQEFPDHRIELLSFDGNGFPRQLGKSYGEMKLMEDAVTRSTLIAESEYVAKITGRLFLRNFGRILRAIRAPLSMMADLRSHGIYDFLHIKASGHHADTRCLVFTPAFFNQRLRGTYAGLDESAGRFIEGLIYDVVMEGVKAGDASIKGRFPREPFFVGTAGHWDKSYNSPVNQAKCYVRGAMRSVAPWLWI